MEYRFKEQGHRHEALVDGEWRRMTGVTTVLGIIAKPALIGWAAGQAVEHFKNNKGRLENEFDLVCEEAKNAHRKKKEEAGAKGTDVHAIIEGIIKEAIDQDEGFVKKETFTNSNQVKHFIKWAIDNKVKFLESEKHIYSEKMFLGGIVDFVCEIDGQLWIGDIKTSSGIYAEAFLQMAGYHEMIEEMGLYENVTGYVVLNLKKDGTFKEARSISNEDNRKAFSACYDLFKIKQKLDNNIIN